MGIIEKPFKDRYDMGFYAGFKHAEKELYSLEDIKRAIDFDRFHYQHGNAIGLKSDMEVENFIKILKWTQVQEITS